MRFYYSGANSFLAPQPLSDKSVGGFMSSSPIPNNLLSNLFGDISLIAIDNNYKETKGIFLKNETGAAIAGVKLYFNYPDDAITKLEVGIVQPSVNDCNELLIERLPNFRGTPYYASFYEADGVENELTLPDMAKDAVIAIWFRRSLLSDARVPKTKDQLLNDFDNSVVLSTEENIEMVVDWV